MSEKRGMYETFAVGLLTGAVLAVALAWQTGKDRDACEPVVDVEYKKVGRQSFPYTVTRQPVRDGARCVLAEVGA
jgi:hypothetical protein